MKQLLLLLALPLAHPELAAQDRGPRIYISADMEGVAGLTSSEQMSSTGREYGYGRKLMTAEVNAAIEAAFAAGASAVLVNDAHGGQTNLLPDELDRRATLISGQPKPFGMMQGIDEGFDAAIFIGYHARGSTADAVHDHTFNGQLKVVRLNGREVGEYGLNAALAGHHGVPVIFVSGDSAAVTQTAEFIPGIETLAVKRGIGVTAARTLHPVEARERIHAGVKSALARRAQVRPVQLSKPITLEVEFATTAQADAAAMVPGMQRVSGRTVRYAAPDAAVAYRVSRLLARLSSS